MSILKGFGCNDLPTVNSVSINHDWMPCGWGSWLTTWTTIYPQGWVIYLDESIPSPAEFASAFAHQNFINGGKWVMMLREQDMKNWGYATYFQYVSYVWDHIHQVDPTVKLAISLGSQYGAVSWGQAMWNQLPQYLKNATKAFTTHYYPQAENENLDFIYNPASISNHVAPIKAWASAQGKELWITEIGLNTDPTSVSGPQVAVDDRSAYYPAIVEQALNPLGIQRWSWYTMSDVEPIAKIYVTLVKGGVKTCTGKVFSAI